MEFMEDFGTAVVFLSDIVAIERGEWRDDRQDWFAILVSNGGARIKTGFSLKDAKQKLEFARREAAEQKR